MIGAILGALHGEGIIDPADSELLDRANRMTLATNVDAFGGVVQALLHQDEERVRGIQASRHQL